MKQFLIAGLGNPGSEYSNTRHNTGFMVIDKLASKLGFKSWVKEKKARAVGGYYHNNRVILIKPQTYMNLSGNSVLAFMTTYKIPPRDLLVIVDDLALPLGKIRFRPKGSNGGHNGLLSIEEKIGGEFPRLRIGIGSPPDNIPAADYVLSAFEINERELINQALDSAVKGVITYLESGIEQAMNDFN